MLSRKWRGCAKDEERGKDEGELNKRHNYVVHVYRYDAH